VLPASTESAGPATPATKSGQRETPNLDQFTVNLTENAKKGKIDPVLGAILRFGR